MNKLSSKKHLGQEDILGLEYSININIKAMQHYLPPARFLEKNIERQRVSKPHHSVQSKIQIPPFHA